MISSQNIKVSQPLLKQVTEFADKLQNNSYPELFDLLNNVRDKIDMLSNEMDISLEQAILNKLFSLLEELFSKEKLVILPYILKLEKEGKRLQNDSLIKNYNALHSNVKLSLIDLESTLKNIQIDEYWHLHILHISQALKLFRDKLEATQQYRNDLLTSYFV